MAIVPQALWAYCFI